MDNINVPYTFHELTSSKTALEFNTFNENQIIEISRNLNNYSNSKNLGFFEIFDG